MASHTDPDLGNSSPDNAQPSPTSAPTAQPERFTRPTTSRAQSLPPQELAPQVLDGAAPQANAASVTAPPGVGQSAEAEAAAIAGVREREAKARLLALRRIEWVAIGLLAVLLGGATWSWRSHSDTAESRREAIIAAPLLRGPRLEPRTRGPQRRAEVWRAAKSGEIKAASQAIKGQLDAFKRDDYNAAVTWQSEDLKRQFGSVSAFRRAIRERYPAFAAYKSVRFGAALSRLDGAVRIKALLRGPQDEPVPAEYYLVRESGAYRIAGVSAPQAREPQEQAPPSRPAEAA